MNRQRFYVRGHRATFTSLNPVPGARRAPLGGWMLGCKCGWQVGPFAVRALAETAYTEHTSAALPICSQCRETKAHHEMSKGSPHLCKNCAVANQSAWKAANPDRFKKAQRRAHLRTKFGMTLDDFDDLLRRQGGRCAICQTVPDDPRGFSPHVDHDHSTGAIRGILCNKCNSGLGQFGDDPALLQRAIDYLRAHATEPALEIAA